MPAIGTEHTARTPREAGELSAAVPFVAMLLVLGIVTSIAILIQPARAHLVAGAADIPRPRLALIGDSITAQTVPRFGAAFGADLEVYATSGKTIADQLGVAAEAAAHEPAHVIINLGSNDVLNGVRFDASAAALEAMVGRFGPTTCVHLVTINEWFFAIFPEGKVLKERAKALNAEIRRLAADRRADIVDWAGVMDDALHRDPQLALTTDSVHPNEAGMDTLTQLYVDAVARGCS